MVQSEVIFWGYPDLFLRSKVSNTLMRWGGGSFVTEVKGPDIQFQTEEFFICSFSPGLQLQLQDCGCRTAAAAASVLHPSRMDSSLSRVLVSPQAHLLALPGFGQQHPGARLCLFLSPNGGHDGRQPLLHVLVCRAGRHFRRGDAHHAAPSQTAMVVLNPQLFGSG